MISIFYLVLAALWVLHFDFWNWESIHPIYLGVFPVGLFYHVLYSAFVIVFMPFFFRAVWPPDRRPGTDDEKR